MNAERTHFDVAVVGAGPAGSSLAIRLALNGFKVALIEQKRFPREKLCGEFISPECLAHFAEIGVLDQIKLDGAVHITETVFFARNGNSTSVKSEWFGGGSGAMGLSRSEMDRLLMRRAQELGVSIIEEFCVTSLTLKGRSVAGVADKTGRNVSAAITIDGTGRSRVLGRMAAFPGKRPAGAKPDFVAFKTHLRGAAIPDDRCEIYNYRGGYGGCSRVEAERYNICFIVKSTTARDLGGDAERLFREVVLKNNAAESALIDAVAIEPWLAVPISSYGRFDLAPADGLLAVGDAGAFIDPFTGSGILLALESANIASEVLVENWNSNFSHIASEYKRRHALAFNRRLRISSMLRFAAFAPFLAETVIGVLARSQRLARLVAVGTRRARSTE